jgi:CubicO group peptidase (beta-lactamase class C family)
MPYEAWVRQEQFLVAGIQRTFFANSDEVVDNKAPSYSHYYRDPVRGEYVKRDQLRQLHEDFPRMMRTDAGAFSTARELARWIMALKADRLLKKPESLHSLWTPVRLNNGKTEGFGEAFTGYALGWPVMQRNAHPVAAAIGGGRAVVMVYPEDDVTVILLTNLSGCTPEEIADTIAGYYFDR